MTAILKSHLSSYLLPVFGTVAEVRCRRNIRKTYGALSHAELRDVGLTAWDVQVALNLPLDQSACDALVRAASVKVGKW